MASRFWVGGTGTWDASDTTHWAATSGGAGGQSVPGSGDTVTLDASSGGGTVTLGYNPTISSFTCGAFTGTFDAVTFSPIISGTMSATGTGTRTIKLGSGTWTMTGSGAVRWDFTTTTNLTFDAGTSTVDFTYSGAVGQRSIVTGTARLNILRISAGSDVLDVTGLQTKDFNLTGFTGSLNGNVMDISGNLTLGAGMKLNGGSNVISMTATSGTNLITSNGVAITQNFTINAPGAIVRLADEIVLGSTRTFTVTAGSFETNNNNLTTGLFNSSNTNTRSLTFGTSTVTLTGTGTVWNLGTTTGLTFSAASSTIIIQDSSSSSKTFQTGGVPVNYGTITVMPGGSGQVIFTQSNGLTINTFNCTGLKNLSFTAGRTYSITNWNVNGYSGAPVSIVSSSAGSAATISIASGTINSYYLSLQDSTATGGATFNAINSRNVSGNSGWAFTSRRGPASLRERIRNISNSILFNGSTAKVSVDAAATTAFGTGNFTMGLKIKAIGYASNASFNVIYSGYSADVSGQRNFILAFNQDLTLSAYIDSGSSTIATTTAAITFNQWYDVALRRRGAELTIWLNGRMVGYVTGVQAAIATGSVAATFGQHPAATSTFSFNGYQTDQFMFSRALTDDEMYRVAMDGPSFVSQTSLVFYWPNSDGAGATLTDASGNNHPGTLSVGAWTTDSPQKARSQVSSRSQTSNRTPADFNPLAISASAFAWWDIASGIVFGSGTAVASWADRVGGAVMSQATGSKRPSYTYSVASGQYINAFNSASQKTIETPQTAFSSISAYTVSFVFGASGTVTNQILMSADNNAATVQILTNQLNCYVSATSYGAFGFSDSLAGHVLTMIFDGSQTGDANRLKIYLDGVQKTLSFSGSVPATTSSGQTAFALGDAVADPLVPFNGSIGDVMMFSSALSDANRRNVELYLGRKYGIYTP